jgi:hypothetical protein
MFGNQRFERDVGQNIAAVNHEGFFPENAFDIFDSTPGFEQVRLMSERKGMTLVTVPREKFMKQVWQPVRVDHKGLHACRNQMIERKGNERLLKNRDERLRQILCQRPQACTEPSSENESLRDFVHRTTDSVNGKENYWKRD